MVNGTISLNFQEISLNPIERYLKIKSHHVIPLDPIKCWDLSANFIPINPIK
jgi:hypothetical protein